MGVGEGNGPSIDAAPNYKRPGHFFPWQQVVDCDSGNRTLPRSAERGAVVATSVLSIHIHKLHVELHIKTINVPLHHTTRQYAPALPPSIVLDSGPRAILCLRRLVPQGLHGQDDQCERVQERDERERMRFN